METAGLIEKDKYRFLQGGGEMGELIRAYDWSGSPLGTPDNWSQGLRTTLGIVLHSAFPMFLFWGEELICFYNDPFRPSLGAEGKHSAIGKSGKQVWPEIWDFIGPLIEQVMTTGQPVWFEDQLVPFYRNGKIENIYWTFSYSPVYGDGGDIAGVIVVCSETTGKVENINRLEIANKRFRDMVMQAPVAIAVFRGADFIADIVNDAYLPLVAKTREEFIGRPLFDSLPETREILEPLVKQVVGSGIAYTAIEFEVPINRNGREEICYFNFVYEPLVEGANHIDGLMVVAHEVTEQVRTRKKIEDSEKRFRNLIAESPISTAVFTGADMILDIANDAMIKLWGKDKSIIGKRLLEIMPEQQDQRYIELLQRVFKYGETVSEEAALVYINRNGRLESFYRDFSYKPLYNDQGEIYGILAIVVDVTEKVVTQRKLEESEQRYRVLTEEGTVATALYLGPEIKIQYVNDRMLQYWGRDNTVVGKTFREALPELETQPFPALLDQVYKTGKTYVGKEEKAYMRIDGRLQPGYYNFTYKALYNPEGSIYGIHHSAIDVTEQVMARKRVEESVQKVRTIVESAPFPIAVYTGKEMLVELANQSIMDIWGKGNDVIGKLFTDIMPELGNQEVFEQIRKVYETGVSFHTRNTRLDLIVNGKKRPYWFNYSFTPLYDSDGNIYGVMNTGVDNTDLNLAKQQVEENERSFRNTILRAPVAMCIFRGTQHVVEIANERMTELWGKTLDDVMDKPIFEGLREAKDQGFEQILDNVFATGETHVAQDIPVNLPRDGDIETVYVNFLFEAYREANGDISGIIAVATDVTAQVLARQKIEEIIAKRTNELATVNNNLQRSNAELAQFAYIASHDLQEPVRKVSTYTQMLENSLGEINDKSKNYLNKINGATERMLRLIRDVLAYSQLSNDVNVFEPVDLSQVAESVKTDFELLIEQKQAEVIFEGLPTVDAIPLQMSQLFTNLISNGLKFSRKDVNPVIRIKAAILSKDELSHYDLPGGDTTWCCIEFADNGIGFDQEYADKIFHIFQRLHGKSEYAGTGIGLATCKKIVENHEGRIFATGEKGNGSVFNVILPLRHKTNSEMNAG